MTADTVIEEIKNLPTAEQSRVFQFVFELAQTRKLRGNELSALAQQLAGSSDPAEVEKLNTALKRGFYGN